jgi:uncharacterized protein (TIGR03437 family)
MRSVGLFVWSTLLALLTTHLPPLAVAASRPTLSGITPASAVAGASDIAIDLTGYDFNVGAFAGVTVCGATRPLQTVVNFGGVDIPTVFQSANRLIATIPASLLAVARTVSVTARTDSHVECQPNVTGEASNAVSFTVLANQMTAAPNSLALTVSSGAVSSGADSITVSGLGQPTSFVASSSVPWLGLSLSSAGPFGQIATGMTAAGSGGTAVYVRADASGLAAAASYAGSITIASPGRTAATVNVLLTVQGYAILLNPSTVAIAVVGGGSNTGTFSASAAYGGASIPITISPPAAPWLTVSPSTAVTGQPITLTASGSGYATGVYSTTLTVSGPSPSAPKSLTVTMQVKAAPVLSAQPASLALTAASGATSASGRIELRFDGESVPYTVSASPAWLTASPTSGQGASAITVSANLSAMRASPASGTVTVTPTVSGVAAISIPVTLTVAASDDSPRILADGVVNGASLLPGIAAGSWVTIRGANFTTAVDCDASRNPGPGCRSWKPEDFAGGTPTSLDDVTVLMNDKPAYVYFVSPTQLNVLAPDLAAGPVEVTVRRAKGTSNVVVATADAYAPAFFTYGEKYAVATHADGTVVGARGSACSGCSPARRGETITLWGTGFGPADPAVPAGRRPLEATGGQIAYTPTPSVTIGGVAAKVLASALAPDAFGLYQVAITIPDGAPAGDQPVAATVGGKSSPAAGVVIPVE